jgi:hypothetical protein
VIAQAVRLPLLVVALASASAGAGATPKPVALTAVPARVVLVATTHEAVRVTNSGTRAVVVDVSKAGFALTLRGRPRIVRARGKRSAASWLELRPTRLTLPARASASLVVSAAVPRDAEPRQRYGDACARPRDGLAGPERSASHDARRTAA